MKNRKDIRNILSLHVLNHVLTARTRVQKHTRRIKELADRAKETDFLSNADEEDEERWRDQGYTKAKVLILLPTRGTCLSFVKNMVELLGEAGIVDNMDRFEAEYGMVDDAEESETNGVETIDESEKRRKSVLESKGPDWQELFGDDVNNDDDFKIGIALSPKVAGGASRKKKTETSSSTGSVSFKLYSEFYRSDIIIASPIGLKIATSGSDEKEEDVDFLSSIDICVVGHSDVLMMQNWDH
eukprot:scaffold339070_cov59-Attheya_sp.AAC.2